MIRVTEILDKTKNKEQVKTNISSFLFEKNIKKVEKGKVIGNLQFRKYFLGIF